jgi:hypothetical protein
MSQELYLNDSDTLSDFGGNSLFTPLNTDFPALISESNLKREIIAYFKNYLI